MNDNDPVWIFPSQIENSVNISWRAPAGTVISVVKAIDPDANAGKQTMNYVRYALVAHSGPGVSLTTSSDYLLLNENSGELVIQRELSLSNVGFHNLRLVARDRGDPQRSVDALLRLFVTDTPHSPQHVSGAVSSSGKDHRASSDRAIDGDWDGSNGNARRRFERDWRSGRTERVDKNTDVVLFGFRLDSAAQQVCIDLTEDLQINIDFLFKVLHISTFKNVSLLLSQPYHYTLQ